MAKLYFKKLTNLINEIEINETISSSFEIKHFFSGAALYVNGIISVSLSPTGLAFKLPEEDVSELLDTGRAMPLKYFPNGHIKKGYALFPDPDLTNTEKWQGYIIKSAERVECLPPITNA